MNKLMRSMITGIALACVGLSLCSDIKPAKATTTYNVGYASAPSCTVVPGYGAVLVNSYGQVSSSPASTPVTMQCPLPMDSSLTYNSLTATFWSSATSTNCASGNGYVYNANTGASVATSTFAVCTTGLQSITLSGASLTTGADTWLSVGFNGPVIFIGYSLNHN